MSSILFQTSIRLNIFIRLHNAHPPTFANSLLSVCTAVSKLSDKFIPLIDHYYSFTMNLYIIPVFCVLELLTLARNPIGIADITMSYSCAGFRPTLPRMTGRVI